MPSSELFGGKTIAKFCSSIRILVGMAFTGLSAVSSKPLKDAWTLTFLPSSSAVPSMERPDRRKVPSVGIEAARRCRVDLVEGFALQAF